MPQRNAGISFHETMSGPFALGATSPADGAARGASADTILTMNASVLIPDVNAFTADRDHPGSLTGDISFPPLGTALPATRGVFKLFAPADAPELKLMVYELAFEHGGQHYYLAGKKEVRDDPGLDLWADTTTLLTRLHTGDDASGPVVGAGILRLGMAELVKLLGSVTTPGAETAGERTAAVAAFGRFFLGRLWDSYARYAMP